MAICSYSYGDDEQNRGGYNCRHQVRFVDKSSAEHLRKRLADALAVENYEGAAVIQRWLDNAEAAELLQELEAMCDEVGVALPKVTRE